MKNLKKEYDAFGPWIIKIKSQEEIPRAFDKLIKYDKKSDSYKIPRNITRREARPGDQLYKNLVCFKKNELIFLDNNNGSVIMEVIQYSNIKSIQNRVDLLNGSLIIQSQNKRIKIPYNAVSIDLIAEAIFKLRKAYIKYFNTTDLVPIQKDYALPKSYFYKGILSKMKNKEDIFVLEAQETEEIIKKDKKWYDHFLDVYNPMVFQKIMFLMNQKELVIISRKDGIKRKRSTDYSHIHTYIPLDSIENIVYKEDMTYEALYKVSIVFSNNKHCYYTINPDFLNFLL